MRKPASTIQRLSTRCPSSTASAPLPPPHLQRAKSCLEFVAPKKPFLTASIISFKHGLDSNNAAVSTMMSTLACARREFRRSMKTSQSVPGGTCSPLRHRTPRSWRSPRIPPHNTCPARRHRSPARNSDPTRTRSPPSQSRASLQRAASSQLQSTASSQLPESQPQRAFHTASPPSFPYATVVITAALLVLCALATTTPHSELGSHPKLAIGLVVRAARAAPSSIAPIPRVAHRTWPARL